jgi:hypothetical protein
MPDMPLINRAVIMQLWRYELYTPFYTRNRGDNFLRSPRLKEDFRYMPANPENLIKLFASADLARLGYTGITFEHVTPSGLLWEIEFNATFRNHRQFFSGKVHQDDTNSFHLDPNSIRMIKQYS